MKDIKEIMNIVKNGEKEIKTKELKSKTKFKLRLLLSGVIAAVSIAAAIFTMGASIAGGIAILGVGCGLSVCELNDALVSKTDDVKNLNKAKAEYEVISDFYNKVQEEVKQEIKQNTNTKFYNQTATKTKAPFTKNSNVEDEVTLG